MADLIKQNIAEVRTRLEQDISPVNITGLSGTALPYFFSKFLEDIGKPCLAILPSQKEADRLYEELSFSCPTGLPLNSVVLRDYTSFRLMT